MSGHIKSSHLAGQHFYKTKGLLLLCIALCVLDDQVCHQRLLGGHLRGSRSDALNHALLVCIIQRLPLPVVINASVYLMESRVLFSRAEVCTYQ